VIEAGMIHTDALHQTWQILVIPGSFFIPWHFWMWDGGSGSHMVVLESNVLEE
jgi:3-mercaptopyruvate sulfurtransferase SseA